MDGILPGQTFDHVTSADKLTRMGAYTNSFRRQKGLISDKFESYFTIYDELLANSEIEIKNILEIGVQNGGSLEVWARALPHSSSILGLDIEPDCERLLFDDPRIECLVADASSTKVLDVMGDRTFNLIIDDGSHDSVDVVNSFWNLIDRLTPGGSYVIEDLHTSYWEKKSGGIGKSTSSLAFIKDLMDLINFEHWEIQIEKAEALEWLRKKFALGSAPETLFQIDRIVIKNSICVITKSKHATDTSLGMRLVTGSKAILEVDISAQNKTIITPSVKHLSLSNPFNSVSDNYSLALQAKLALATKEVADIKRSRSWRYTKPFRDLFRVK